MPKQTGLRLPIKTVELEFTDDGYPGFTAKARTNAPLYLLGELTTDEDRARAAILRLYPEWNFVDEDGEPIPHTAEGIALMPEDLLQAMLLRRQEAIKSRIGLGPKVEGDGSSSPTSPAEPEELMAEPSPNPTPA